MKTRDDRVPPEAFQEFLEAIAEAETSDSTKRAKRLLQSYAELRFRMFGAGRCAVCHTTVRHVLPVRSTREDGTVTDYPCLCTRCMAAERATSQHVVVKVGRASVSYTGGKQRPVGTATPSARRKFQNLR